MRFHQVALKTPQRSTAQHLCVKPTAQTSLRVPRSMRQMHSSSSHTQRGSKHKRDTGKAKHPWHPIAGIRAQALNQWRHAPDTDNQTCGERTWIPSQEEWPVHFVHLSSSAAFVSEFGVRYRGDLLCHWKEWFSGQRSESIHSTPKAKEVKSPHLSRSKRADNSPLTSLQGRNTHSRLQGSTHL